jgi:nucleoside-diphosphate-sugar epimerase
MATQPQHDRPILVTGAAGAIGAVGRSITENLLAKGQPATGMREFVTRHAAAFTSVSTRSPS